MKRIVFFESILLLITFSFLIISCSNDNVNQPYQNNGLLKISGRLTDWNYGTGKSLSMYTNPPYVTYLVGNSLISPNGDFSILLSSPPASELKPVLELETLTGNNNLSISDTTVKGCFSEFLIQLDTANYFIGEVIPGPPQNIFSVGSYFVKYIYLEKPMTITGKQYYNLFNDSIEVVYNLDYSEGWNIRTYKMVEITEIDSSKSFIKSEYNNKQEPDMVFKTHIF